MSVILSKNDNIFKYKYKNISKSFYDSNLNVIFYDKDFNEIKTLSVNKLNIYLEKIKNLNYDYIFIFSYNFKGNSNLIDYFTNKYDLSFIKFCNINLYFYGIINIKTNYREEKIFEYLHGDLEINIINNYELNYKELNNEKLDLDLKINKFVKSIKNFSLKDICFYKKKIRSNYDKLNLFINDVNKSYELVNKIINENNDSLNSDIKIQHITKNDEKLDKLENKQFYFINLLKKIEINEKKQMKRINELNNINKLIDESENILREKKLYLDKTSHLINNINYTKNNYENEINKLKEN